MNYKNLWKLAEQVIQVLGDEYEPVIPGIASQLGLETTVFYSCLLTAKIFEPEPITIERLRVRNPYASPKLYTERLSNAAVRGFLRPVEQDGFLLTEKGERAIRSAILAIYGCLTQMSPLPAKKLGWLAALLWKLVEASLAAPEPPGHWCLAHSRIMDPGLEAPIMVRIDQYLSDLAAYRDDAHLASWKDSGVDGPAWDALTCLWRESPLFLEDIFSKLKRRGWEKADYALRLDQLIQKGWVSQDGLTFTILPGGKEIRQQAENLTDEYFYRPWKSLSDDEMNELEDMLNNIAE